MARCLLVWPYASYPRRKLWRGFRAHLRREWRDVGQVVVAIAAAVAGIAFLDRNFYGGVLAGLLAMFLVAMIAWNYLINDDGLRYLHGAWAEDWTREELRAAVKQRRAWHALDNVPLSGGDVDHVLVAPAGVIAVETKFFGKESRSRYVDEHVAAAARAALRVRALLRTVRSYQHPVHALLVIWGPGARPLGEVRRVGDVTVVQGRMLKELLNAYSTGSLAQDHADTVAEALSAYRKALPGDR